MITERDVLIGAEAELAVAMNLFRGVRSKVGRHVALEERKLASELEDGLITYYRAVSAAARNR